MRLQKIFTPGFSFLFLAAATLLAVGSVGFAETNEVAVPTVSIPAKVGDGFALAKEGQIVVTARVQRESSDRNFRMEECPPLT